MRRFALPIFIALARSNDAFAPKQNRNMRHIIIYNNRETIPTTTTNVPDASTLETLPPTALTTLRSQSLAIVRDFLAPELVRQLRRDVEDLRRDGPASQAAAAEHGSVDWFELLPSRPFSPNGNSNHGRESLYTLVEDLRTAIEGTMNIKVDAHLTELKYAYYPHGGYYRKHLDALNAGSRSREFSFILYLNNEWEPAHGGHLRVFLDYDSEETRSVLPDHSKRLDAFHASNLNYIDVPPLAGTMVLFKSDTVPHEVRPTSQKRIAIVGWFNRELSDDEVPKLDEEDLTPLAQAILEHYREKGEAVKF